MQSMTNCLINCSISPLPLRNSIRLRQPLGGSYKIRLILVVSNIYAQKTLTRLYFAIRLDNTIHFYNETSQNIDHVLDIFIRTNHGGTPLFFSDLLMSIAIANWQKDAREQIDNL